MLIGISSVSAQSNINDLLAAGHHAGTHQCLAEFSDGKATWRF